MSSKRPAWLCSALLLQPQGSHTVHSKSQPPAPKDGSEEVLHLGISSFPTLDLSSPTRYP